MLKSKRELDIDSGVKEKDVKVDGLNNKFKKLFAKNIIYKENHLKLLLIDLSTYYSTDADVDNIMLWNHL